VTKKECFGSFWLNRLDVGEYSLAIMAEGFHEVIIRSIRTDKDINLGDIPLEAKGENQ
jgi:hypothetical protein